MIFTLSMIPNWKALQQPKLLSVKARPSAKLDFLCSTFGFLVQLLVPFLVLYFRFSRATSGALSRALLSVFSCNFSCPFSCSTFGFLVQLLVLYFRFSRATSRALSRAFFLLLVCFHVLFGPTSFDYLLGWAGRFVNGIAKLQTVYPSYNQFSWFS